MKNILFALMMVCAVAAQAQRTVKSTNSFTITGVVKNKLTIAAPDLLRFEQKNIGELTIKNHKGEVKFVSKGVKGVLLTTLLDSASILADKPKEYAFTYIVLTASDGYRNVYSWVELYNSPVGEQVYLITEIDGKKLPDIPQQILVCSLSDKNTGMRYFKGLSAIEVRKAQ